MKRAVLVIVGGVIIIGLIIVGLALGIGYFLAPQSDLSKVDAIVAVSGGETEARAGEAIRLYQDHYASVLIFSGAAEDTSGPSNAKVMQLQAEEAGVDSRDILIEETSNNTTQNAQAVAQIARHHGYHSIILVTSPYHQRRAYISFSRALGPDVRVLNHSAVDHRWRRSDWWANPYAYSVTLAELQKTVFLLVTGSK